jgi:hypothetical protein
MISKPAAVETVSRTPLRKLKWAEGVDWIHLAQDRVQWQVVVNTAMDLWIPQNTGNLIR